MVLIKDAGLRYATPRSKKRTHYGLYECPCCSAHFEARIADVNKGKSTKCRGCADKVRNDSRSLKASLAFIAEATRIHNGRYVYSKVVYEDCSTPVIIGCLIHGDYRQRPDVHKNGRGCPDCGREVQSYSIRISRNNTIATALYYIYFPEVNLWKIGCTSKTVEERFQRDTLKYQIIFSKLYNFGYEAYMVEKYLLRATISYKYKGDIRLVQGGNTELRTKVIDNILHLIEEAEQTIEEIL